MRQEEKVRRDRQCDWHAVGRGCAVLGSSFFTSACSMNRQYLILTLGGRPVQHPGQYARSPHRVHRNWPGTKSGFQRCPMSVQSTGVFLPYDGVWFLIISAPLSQGSLRGAPDRSEEVRGEIRGTPAAQAR